MRNLEGNIGSISYANLIPKRGYLILRGPDDVRTDSAVEKTISKIL